MAIALNKRKVKSTAKLKNAKHNEWMWGYILVAPTVIGLLILNIIPLIQTFILSFQKQVILDLLNGLVLKIINVYFQIQPFGKPQGTH